jgi:hypothetical protein
MSALSHGRQRAENEGANSARSFEFPMTDLFSSFISKAFLRSVWALEFEAFKGSEEEVALDDRLRRWSARKDLRETSAEAAFIQSFFHDLGVMNKWPSSCRNWVVHSVPKFPITRGGRERRSRYR